ncbi:MAG: peptide deformylase [Clostridia bacterium]|nr:peptide deformylase [Clostridia bacterium]
MAILNLIFEDDPMLRRVSRPVEAVTPRIEQLLDDMTETMRANNGCGLAAVQVGVLRRVVVIEVEPGEVLELINPRIIAWSGHQEEQEGCLSLPGKWGKTKRPAAVVVRAEDRTGREIEVRGDGLLCRALCHEIDHLDGKLFTDVLAEPLDDPQKDKKR